MFNDFQYYQKIWEAWYKLWLDNGFNLPQEADDACENASSDIESKAVYQTNIEALQQELLQAQQQFMKAIAEINSNIARQK
jgi:hypothetical protein